MLSEAYLWFPTCFTITITCSMYWLKLVRVNFAATAKVVAALSQSNRSIRLPWIRWHKTARLPNYFPLQYLYKERKHTNKTWHTQLTPYVQYIVAKKNDFIKDHATELDCMSFKFTFIASWHIVDTSTHKWLLYHASGWVHQVFALHSIGCEIEQKLDHEWTAITNHFSCLNE